MPGITSLPVELYDKITQHYARNPSREANEHNTYRLKTYEFGPSKHETYKVKTQRLKNLRLVSKPLCQSASRLLFRRFNAWFRGGEESPTVVAALTALQELCQSDHARFVQKLGVGCRGHDSKEACQEYLSYFQKVFASCLERLPSLQRLTIIHCDRDATTTTIETTMEEACIEAFQLVALPKLKELHLWKVQGNSPYFSPPCNSTRPASALQNLTYLDINFNSVKDSRGGSWIFAAIQQNCCNLRHVNLDLSEDGSLSFIHQNAPLRSLSFYETTISCEQLLMLRRFRDTVTDVDLKHVRLSSGVWAEVFMELSRFPILRHLGVYVECGGDMLILNDNWLRCENYYEHWIRYTEHGTANHGLNCLALDACRRQVLRNRKDGSSGYCLE